MLLCYYVIMLRTTIYLTEELHKRLKLWAVEHNQSMSEVITMALETITFLMVKREEAKKSLTPKQTIRIKEQAKLMTKKLNEFKTELDNPRAKLDSDNYV